MQPSDPLSKIMLDFLDEHDGADQSDGMRAILSRGWYAEMAEAVRTHFAYAGDALRTTHDTDNQANELQEIAELVDQLHTKATALVAKFADDV